MVSCILAIIFLTSSMSLILMIGSTSAGPSSSWPSDSDWIWIDYDKNEDGSIDDWRDVKNAYYYFNGTHLFLRLECYDVPGSKWPAGDARYKWFINTTQRLYMSGGNIIGGSYLLFVEDTDNDGQGEIYLLKDVEGDGKFDEYSPGQPYDYRNYEVTDLTNVTFRIIGNHIDMAVSWASLGNPSSYGLIWATDQENPNLNQAPTTDHPDEEIGLVRHDVAAISQTVNATEVEQGKMVEISVVVKNYGTVQETFDVSIYFWSAFVGKQRITLDAGATTTLTFTWNTSLVPPGTYSIMAFADSAGEITEINEDDNWCTAPATVTVKIHDVAAISQTTNITLVERGKGVRIDVKVKNLGNYTETFNVTVYYDNAPIGTKTVNSLAPGDEIIVSFEWDTSGVRPETYFIKAFVDSSRTITELNETNNNCTTTTPVIVYSTAAPSISVEKVLVRVVSGPDPAIIGHSTTYEIEILVANTGNVVLEKVNLTDYIWGGVTGVALVPGYPGYAEIRPVNGQLAIVWNMSSLGLAGTGNDTATLRFRVTLTPSSSGVHVLNRGRDLTAEGKHDTTVVSDTADLDVVVLAYRRDVAAVSQTPLKSTVIQRELVGIDVEVRNSGDYYAETFNVTLYYSPDGITWTEIEPIDTIRVFNLGMGGSITLRFVWDTEGVAPGRYYIKAFADSGRELLETDEVNNNCTQPAAIKIEVHDIVAVRQEANVTLARPGDPIKITGILRNGGSESETFIVRCYYGAPEIPPIQIGSDKTMTLAPGADGTVEFDWDTSGVAPGTYWIEIRAVPVEAELDIHDNACGFELRILLAPVGGEITGITLTALITALKSLISPIITALMIIMTAAAIASALAAYIIYKRTRRKTA